MAISLVSVSSANNAGTTSAATVTAPTSISSGNALVALITHSSGQTVTLPSGWTSITSQAGSDSTFQIATKIAGSSEPSSYVFTPVGTANVDVKVTILNASGVDSTTPINGFFPITTETTAAQTAGSTTGTQSIPTRVACVPIAMFCIEQLNPSNSGAPSGLTSGFTQQALNVWEDTSNFTNTANNNGYSATFIASGPPTSDTTTAITAGCTWGGAYSAFSPSITAMVFLNPVVAGTLSASPSTISVPGNGTSNAVQITISEPNYSGTITVSVPTASQSIISISATQTGTYGTSVSLTGPSASFWVQGLAPGNFTIQLQG